MKASDVFDILVSCADFETFKELMLSHKSMREVCVWVWGGGG
jgi:hypothetical protein